MAKKFPDLNRDGEISQADILIGKGVIEKKKGGWIKDAIKKPGALKKALGVKKGEKIPAGKLAAAAKKPGKMGQRARLAKVLRGLKK